MIDPTCSAILDVLTAIEEPSHFVDGNLRCLIPARMVNLSVKHGNSDGSPAAYVRLGWCWEGLHFNREQRRASRASRTAPKVTGRAMVSCTSPSTRAKAILGPRFGDEEAGFRFGQLGLDLVE